MTTGRKVIEVRPLNLFPAAVRVGDDEWSPAKVTSYDDRVAVFALRQGLPTLVAVIDADQVGPPEVDARTAVFAGRRRPVVAAGGDVVIARAPGCGCSHPLKRFRPPATLPEVTP